MPCPLLGKCNKKVDHRYYLTVCLDMESNKYETCDIFQKIMGDKKTPSEWAKLLGFIPSST